jgi:hypothetical protein
MIVREAPDAKIVTTGMDYNCGDSVVFTQPGHPYESAAAALQSAATLGS